METVGTIIRKIRKSDKMTQKCMAQKLNTHKVNISHYEVERVIPPADRFLEILRMCPDDNELLRLIRCDTLKVLPHET